MRINDKGNLIGFLISFILHATLFLIIFLEFDKLFVEPKSYFQSEGIYKIPLSSITSQASKSQMEQKTKSSQESGANQGETLQEQGKTAQESTQNQTAQDNQAKNEQESAIVIKESKNAQSVKTEKKSAEPKKTTAKKSRSMISATFEGSSGGSNTSGKKPSVKKSSSSASSAAAISSKRYADSNDPIGRNILDIILKCAYKITYDERNLLAINSEHKQTIVIEIPPKGDPKMSFAKKSGIKILEDVIIKAFNQTKHKFPRPSTTKSYSYAVLWITEEPDLRYVDQDACR